ncbi:hypothetical protein [Rhizobium leguminosarum]
MFAVMMDRIERIKDSLLRDDTTRDLLISVSDEHVTRRSISNLFRQHAHGFYRVSQESVTAEEEETDIRLSSIRTDHEAVIEIKIGDNHWSAGVLRDTIRRQLVEKYMAPENRCSGCLMITVHGRKKWKHPDTRSSIDASGLSELLETEARVVERDIGSGVHLAVARNRPSTSAPNGIRTQMQFQETCCDSRSWLVFPSTATNGLALSSGTLRRSTFEFAIGHADPRSDHPCSSNERQTCSSLLPDA